MLEQVYQDASLPYIATLVDGTKRQTFNSLPSLTAEALAALDVAPGHRVLEVGTGTGYAAALLAELVGPSGAVVSIDIVPPFVDLARRAMRQLGIDNVRVVEGDGAYGHPSAGPFERGLVQPQLEASSATLGQSSSVPVPGWLCRCG